MVDKDLRQRKTEANSLPV